eukprot:5471096-Amphidinium_carterae.2
MHFRPPASNESKWPMQACHSSKAHCHRFTDKNNPFLCSTVPAHADKELNVTCQILFPQTWK